MTSHSKEFQRWRWRVLVSTYLAYAGFYFCRRAFYVVKASLGEQLHLDAAALGQLGTAYLVAYTIGQFATAFLGARWGPRVMLLTGMAFSLGANLAFGFANNFWTLYVFMCVNGIAQSTGWAAAIGNLAFWTERQERGVVLGIWSTCYQLGGVLANAWAAFWLARQGFRGAFFAASLVLGGIWIFVWVFQRNRPEDVGLAPLSQDPASANKTETEATGPLAQIVLTTLVVGLFYFGVKFVRYALWSWAPYFLQKNFHLEGDSAGYLATLFDVGGFLGVLCAGWVSDRLFAGRRAIVAFGMLVGMTLACAVLYRVGGDSVALFSACLFVVGFMLYGPDALLTGAGAIDIGTIRYATTVAGVINGMGSLGSVVQETVVARTYVASAHHVAPVFGLLFGASLVALFSIALVLWRNRRGVSDL